MLSCYVWYWIAEKLIISLASDDIMMPLTSSLETGFMNCFLSMHVNMYDVKATGLVWLMPLRTGILNIYTTISKSAFFFEFDIIKSS